ncbi:glycosyltransferase [Pseudoduganella namucuonensis]|uniref:Glycosyltransferase involved in cell wall bisynthesis n=1 Tax=Pseudoduganella namucuonensis TaxID=1035707 RepID=A0A1I7M5D5_9BURK|nr:glycosyltransferase [Pseudoduganella namucuonensis]SFV17020.1 Glycosyltransferase involved in cell wall bisynthesis [Pseudoduganella namucuonensis]
MATFDVLLPVKNCIRFLRESIDSICAQSCSDWRLFVLDHGSTDGSLEQAQAYARHDKRILVLQVPSAASFSNLLNYGLEHCDSKYVIRQDADDVSRPRRMDMLASAFEAFEDTVLIGSQARIIDQHGSAIGSTNLPVGMAALKASVFFKIPVLHPSAAMRLSALRRLRARYGEDFIKALPAQSRLTVPSLAEDYFLFGQLALVGQCRNLDAQLLEYRWHGANVSATKSLEQLHYALAISRNLARTFSAMHGLPAFDPAPFCNHGDMLFNFPSDRDFRSGFLSMKNILTKALPNSLELQRDLSFRKVVSDRRSLAMTANYLHHASQHGGNRSEWRTVKSWLLRNVRNREFLTVTGQLDAI